MKNDDKVIAKLPLAEKQEFMDLGERVGLTQGQIVREALQRFKPVLIQRVNELEAATAVPEEAIA